MQTARHTAPPIHIHLEIIITSPLVEAFAALVPHTYLESGSTPLFDIEDDSDDDIDALDGEEDYGGLVSSGRSRSTSTHSRTSSFSFYFHNICSCS